MAPLRLTVVHAAPEVLNGGPASVQSDVYSLASTLYRLLAGRPALVADGEQGLLACIHRAATQEPEPLEAYGVPLPIAIAVRLGMGKDPGDRPKTAADFAETLRRGLRVLFNEPAVGCNSGPTRATVHSTEGRRADRPAATRPEGQETQHLTAVDATAWPAGSLTPDSVASAQFRVMFRGYAVDQVDQFLDAVECDLKVRQQLLSGRAGGQGAQTGLTAGDVDSATFRVTFRGYCVQDVDDFLDKVKDTLGKLDAWVY